MGGGGWLAFNRMRFQTDGMSADVTEYFKVADDDDDRRWYLKKDTQIGECIRHTNVEVFCVAYTVQQNKYGYNVQKERKSPGEDYHEGDIQLAENVVVRGSRAGYEHETIPGDIG